MLMGQHSCTLIDIHRGTTHDGPGMRTTVFFKGCPLNCTWCQNPEGIAFDQEIWWDERKCIHCLACIEACPHAAIREGEDALHIERTKCQLCGDCVEACPSQALAFTGKTWSLEDLLKETFKDRDYYESFGGGVTASGGEPLGQFQFVAELFQALQAQGIHTALDTCGLAPTTTYDAVMPFTDHLLYDIKLLDDGQHQLHTGKSNRAILNNLIYLARHYFSDNPDSRKLWIRTPLIPDVTAVDENIAAIGHFLTEQLGSVVERWELCAFNSACNVKYKKMGQTWAFETTRLMTQAQIDQVKTSALASGFPAEKLVFSGLTA